MTDDKDTSISLQKYIETRFDALTTEIKTASEVLEVRLESMNQFRSQILQEREGFMRKPEYVLDKTHREEQIAALDLRVRRLEDALSNMTGKITAVGAIVTTAFMLFQLLLHMWSIK